MASYFKFDGGKELEQTLLSLGTKNAASIGRRALRIVARKLLVDARGRAPEDEGRLKKSLKLQIDRLKDERSVLSALVYVSSKSFAYRPRKTKRMTRVKGLLRVPSLDYQIGSRPDVYGMLVEFGMHLRGIAARPWFRPAWDAAKTGMVEEIGDEIWAEILRRQRGLAAAPED